MQYLIVVPARGGSKGIPGKNIYPINGKPLLEFTLDVAIKLGMRNVDISVSTDSEKIKEVAKKYKDVVVIDRPSEISGDFSSTESALLHALDFMESRNKKKYDAIITLQATSPLRKIDTLSQFIKFYEKNYPKFNALLSLNENRSDFWHEVKDNEYERLFKNAPRRRQERKPLYIENSAYYITEVNALRKTNSVLGTSVNGFIINDYEAIDINEMIDIYIVKGILSSGVNY